MVFDSVIPLLRRPEETIDYEGFKNYLSTQMLTTVGYNNKYLETTQVLSTPRPKKKDDSV